MDKFLRNSSYVTLALAIIGGIYIFGIDAQRLNADDANYLNQQEEIVSLTTKIDTVNVNLATVIQSQNDIKEILKR